MAENQCDGCAQRLPLNVHDGLHHKEITPGLWLPWMSCQRDRYEPDAKAKEDK